MNGILGDNIELASNIRIAAWDLTIEKEEYFSKLELGYSGSPVCDENGTAFAVVSHRRGEKYGHALCISNLEKICPEIFRELLSNNFSDTTESDIQGYEHDIFISYIYEKGKVGGEWIRDCFKPIFEHLLEDALGKKPDIFYAEHNESQIIPSMLAKYIKTLACSRCLIPIWAPSYFDIKWSYFECSAFKSRNIENYNIFPIVISDGKKFNNHDLIRDIYDSSLKCHDYVYFPDALKRSTKFMDLQDKIRTWVEQIAEAIESVPNWKQEWIEQFNNIFTGLRYEKNQPKFSNPKMR